ncbi:hypothetical protein D3C85_1690760 [compost metagenome]
MLVILRMVVIRAHINQVAVLDPTRAVGAVMTMLLLMVVIRRNAVQVAVANNQCRCPGAIRRNLTEVIGRIFRVPVKQGVSLEHRRSITERPHEAGAEVKRRARC